MKIVVDESWAYLIGLQKGTYTAKVIDSVSSYKVEGYYFSPKYKKGYWDGLKRFREYDRSLRLYKIPSGFLDRVTAALDDANCHYDLEDHREIEIPEEPVYSLSDGKELRDYQAECLDAFIAEGRGIVKAATGSGKSLIGAAAIATYNLPTVWFTDRRALLYQTKDVLEPALGREVGILGDSEKDLRDVTVAMVQTVQARFRKDEEIQKLIKDAQLLILDEVHHLAATNGNQWQRTMQEVKAPYRLGLSGTPVTSGPGLYLIGTVGDVVAEVMVDDLVTGGILAEPRVWLIQSEMPKTLKKSDKYQTAYKKGVVDNRLRNDLVLSIAQIYAYEGIPTITLVKQLKHGNYLADLFTEKGVNSDFLSGKDSIEEREEKLQALKEGRLKNLVANVTIMGEGVDIPWLGAVINATGTRGGGHSGNSKDADVGRGTIQALGRVLRKSPRKAVGEFVDFNDQGNTSLEKASEERHMALREALGSLADKHIKGWYERR